MGPLEALEEVIEGTVRLAKKLASSKVEKVRAKDERELVKAHVFAWFKSHKQMIVRPDMQMAIQAVDEDFTRLLELSDSESRRVLYLGQLKVLKLGLIQFRSSIVRDGDSVPGGKALPRPDFSQLIGDKKMQEILMRRWDETEICLLNGAFLAATVMMGALLEALFLARINRLQDRGPIFKLKCTPIDKKTSKPKQLSEWTLNNYIEVAHEIGWIREPAKKFSSVIRDYRNFIHPERELSEGINIAAEDAKIFWVVFSQVASQVLNSA